ncbi:MAG: dUTP diphosphatase [Candidatus Falkowbacteria bacterium]
MKNNNGKFIVLYGINNLGKTTQAKMLVDRLNSCGKNAEYLKYPIYDLEPSGKILNNYLRKGNIHNLTAREAQIIYTINRTQFEKELFTKLEQGINVVAEDYTGTGIAWGIGAGVDEQFLKYINHHLVKEDLAFLFDGERFMEAEEQNHRHETDNELTNKVRNAHLKLAEEFSWIKIDANLSIQAIHAELWQKIKNIITSDSRNQNNIQYPISNIHNIKIQRLSPTAKIPTRAHANDAGMDLYSNDYYSLLPGERDVIKTGIKIAIPDGCVGLIWDKSGVSKDGVQTTGGVVDSGYRGEILINIINLSQDIYNIALGQKVAQMLIQKIELPEIIEDEINDKTERGEGNFGSTGLF